MTSPDSWEFRDPNTSYLYKETTKEKLIAHIIAYRQQNQLPNIDYLPAVVENYVCRLPSNRHLCSAKPFKRGVMQYLEGGIQLVKQLFIGKFVTPEEADRRSNICTSCKLNVFPDKSTFIAWSDAIAEKTIGKLKAVNYDKLGNCEGCTCVLRAKVWFEPPFTLEKQQATQMRTTTPNCWQLPENEQRDRIDV